MCVCVCACYVWNVCESVEVCVLCVSVCVLVGVCVVCVWVCVCVCVVCGVWVCVSVCVCMCVWVCVCVLCVCVCVVLCVCVCVWVCCVCVVCVTCGEFCESVGCGVRSACVCDSVGVCECVCVCVVVCVCGVCVWTCVRSVWLHERGEHAWLYHLEHVPAAGCELRTPEISMMTTWERPSLCLSVKSKRHWGQRTSAGFNSESKDTLTAQLTSNRQTSRRMFLDICSKSLSPCCTLPSHWTHRNTERNTRGFMTTVCACVCVCVCACLCGLWGHKFV